MVKIAYLGSLLVLLAVGCGSEPKSAPSAGQPLPKIRGVEKAKRLFQGVPQRASRLGKSTAKVTLHEYLDLSCPACAKFSTVTFPKIISRQVKRGELKVVVHHFAFLNRASTEAAKVAILAGRYDRMYEFMELYYLNQPGEKAKFNPYLVQAILKALKLPEQLLEKSRALKVKTLDETLDGKKLEIPGTPSFVLVGPKKRYFMSGAVSYTQLSHAIEAAR